MRPRSRSTSTTFTFSSSPRFSTSSTVFDPLAGRDVGDVQQAVRALGELDERAEGGGLHHLAVELVADLDLLGHRADAVGERVALVARLGVDADGAVVVDVDLRVELLRQRPDRLAALADDRADLLGVDLDLGDPRRVLRAARRAAPRSPRSSCRGSCSRASLACVSASRRMSNVTPVILMSIWSAVMPSEVPATLKSMSPRWSSTPAMSVRTM